MIKRLRVEPISDYLERFRKAQAFPVRSRTVRLCVRPAAVRSRDGRDQNIAFERQRARDGEMKHCLEAAGSSLAKCSSARLLHAGRRISQNQCGV